MRITVVIVVMQSTLQPTTPAPKRVILQHQYPSPPPAQDSAVLAVVQIALIENFRENNEHS